MSTAKRRIEEELEENERQAAIEEGQKAPDIPLWEPKNPIYTVGHARALEEVKELEEIIYNLKKILETLKRAAGTPSDASESEVSKD
jgi:hypothetical protein